MTRILLLFLILFISIILIGCANNSTRFNLDSGEGIYTYSHDVIKDNKEAYYLAEEWLSTNIRKANDVITLRQPDTCTLIAKPSMEVPVGIVSLWGSYTLKINIKGNRLISTYTVGTLDNGTYPPKNSMITIEEYFKKQSDNMSLYINNN